MEKFISFLKNLFAKAKNLVELSFQDGTSVVVDSESTEDLSGKMIATSAGDMVSAGSYVLSDGRTVTVDENSTIVEVLAMEEEKEELEDKVDEEKALLKAKVKFLEMEMAKKVITEKTLNEKLDSLVHKFSEFTKGEKTQKVVAYAYDDVKKKKAAPAEMHKIAQLLHNKLHKKRGFGEYIQASAINDNFSYTYDGYLSTELLYKPTVAVPQLTDMFTIRTGVITKEQLLLAGFLTDKILKKYQGCKNVTPTVTTPALIFNRTLDPEQMEVLIEQCADTFNDTLLEEWKNLGVEVESLEGTTLQQIILNIVQDALARAIFRVVSFGDTASGNAHYNQIDGLWKLLISSSATLGDFGYCTRSHTISSVTPSNVISKLYEIVDGASDILNEIPENQKYIACTRNFYDGYTRALGDPTLYSGVDMAWETLQNGVKQPYFKGIPLKRVSAWSQGLTDSANPLFPTYDTLVLYTTKMNHVIGLAREADQGELKFWYDPDENVNKLRAMPKFGYNYVHCDLSSIGVGNV